MSVSLPHEAEAHPHHEMGFVRKYIFSTDHKIIGIQFLFSSLIFLLLGGLLVAGYFALRSSEPAKGEKDKWWGTKK